MDSSPDTLRAAAESFAKSLAADLARPVTKDAWRGLIGKLHEKKWLGPDFESYAEAGAVLEGLSLGGADVGVPMVLTVNYLMSLKGLAKFAPEAFELVRRGEGLACMAASEPKVGSHPKKIQATAKREGDAWVLNGQKVFTTGGPLAAVILVLAVCGETAGGEQGGKRDLGLFVVPVRTPGVTMKEMPVHPGLECAPHGAPLFENVRVPLSARIGGQGAEGNGWSNIVKPFRQWEDALLQSWVAGQAAHAARELVETSQSNAPASAAAPSPFTERGTGGEVFRTALGRLLASTRALQTLARDSARSLDEEENVGARFLSPPGGTSPAPTKNPRDLIARRYGFYEHLRGMGPLVDEAGKAMGAKAPPALPRLRALLNQLQFAAASRTKIVEGLV